MRIIKSQINQNHSFSYFFCTNTNFTYKDFGKTLCFWVVLIFKITPNTTYDISPCIKFFSKIFL